MAYQRRQSGPGFVPGSTMGPAGSVDFAGLAGGAGSGQWSDPDFRPDDSALWIDPKQPGGGAIGGILQLPVNTHGFLCEMPRTNAHCLISLDITDRLEACGRAVAEPPPFRRRRRGRVRRWRCRGKRHHTGHSRGLLLSVFPCDPLHLKRLGSG